MLERMIRRRRMVLWVAAGLYLLVCVLGTVWIIAANRPDAVGPAIFLFFMTAPYVLFFRLSKWGLGSNPVGKLMLASGRFYGQPIDVLRTIDAEIAVGPVRWFGCRPNWLIHLFPTPDFIVLTPNWLVQVNRAGISVVGLADILWVFKNHRRYIATWGIPRIARGFRVYFQPGAWESIPMRDVCERDELLDELLRRRPEVLAGLYEDWHGMLDDGATRLAAEVERRRREWSALAESQRVEWLAEQREQLSDAVHSSSPRNHGLHRVRDQGSEPSDAGRRATPRTRRYPRLEWLVREERSYLIAAFLFLLAATAFWLWITIIQPLLALLAHGGLRAEQVDTIVLGVIGLVVVVAMWVLLIYRDHCVSFLPSFWHQLLAHGEPKKVIDRIDAELQESNGLYEVCWPLGFDTTLLYHTAGFVTVTPNWLVRLRPFRSVVIHLPDLVWIHRRSVPQAFSLYGGRDRVDLGCCTRSGKISYVELDTEDQLDDVLEQLFAWRPAVITGWLGEYLDQRDHEEEALWRAYQDRERQYNALPPERQQAWLDESWENFHRLPLNAD